MAVARSDQGPLLGRDAEIGLLTSLLDRIESGGGALVLRGEPGIGKSRLLSQAVALAEERQMSVLAARGVQSEARVAFGGLQQLLRPVRSQVTGLAASHQAVLKAALGIAEGQPAEPFRIALAVLDLLSDAATESPLLVVADDAHWLDQPSLDTLAFVARRLESDPIVLLASVREGYPTVFDAIGLPELRLQPLDPASATRLLGESSGHLTARERSRILREAAGNPLALVELPSIARRLEDEQLMPGLVPLTERLERAFAARAAGSPRHAAPAPGRRSQRQREPQRGARGRTYGRRSPVGVEALQPAADATIVELDERTVRFRHPLMRSAVHQSASVEQRRRAHEALAETLAAEPDRRVWHRAALIAGTHEDVALELEEAGRRARRRGAVSVAATALRRAAELSEPAQRAKRLIAAAEVAFELGQPHVVAPLLREAEQLEPGPLERARAAWIDEMINLRAPSPTWVAQLIAAAEQAGEAGDRDLHFALLWLVATRFWWADPGLAARRILVEAAIASATPTTCTCWRSRRMPIRSATHQRCWPASSGPPLRAATTRRLAVPGPSRGRRRRLRHRHDVAQRGDRRPARRRTARAPDVRARDPRDRGNATRRLGRGNPGRRGGQVPGDRARPAALEGGSGHPRLQIAGMRGDEDAAERASAEAERIAAPTGANNIVALAQFGRVSAALGASRHDDAYKAAERLFDPTDPAHHPAMASWIIGDLAEAALHAGRVEEARARVAQIEAAAGDSPTVWIALGLRHARALLADDEQAEQTLRRGTGRRLGRWPFQRARLLLAHGQWLRRQRRITESRTPLREARDAFDALGCAAFSDQARRELRASGESSRRRDPAARDQLTAQELQIAQLAAQGLSNREIGQRLYVSHRTVGTHLYRIFPKLGITVRGELGPALSVDAALQGR